jgi:hypothetical protein
LLGHLGTFEKTIRKMEFNELFLAKNERGLLSRSSRITNSVFGLILTIVVLVAYQFREIALLAIGILYIIYGIVGLELFKNIYSIKVSHNSLEIVKSHHQDILIDLNLVVFITLKNNELQVHYFDYVKTYSIPWLSGEDYDDLRDKLEEICNEMDQTNN